VYDVRICVLLRLVAASLPRLGIHPGDGAAGIAASPLLLGMACACATSILNFFPGAGRALTPMTRRWRDAALCASGGSDRCRCSSTTPPSGCVAPLA
jgi:hypothetical protein